MGGGDHLGVIPPQAPPRAQTVARSNAAVNVTVKCRERTSERCLQGGISAPPLDVLWARSEAETLEEELRGL